MRRAPECLIIPVSSFPEDISKDPGLWSGLLLAVYFRVSELRERERSSADVLNFTTSGMCLMMMMKKRVLKEKEIQTREDSGTGWKYLSLLSRSRCRCRCRQQRKPAVCCKGSQHDDDDEQSRAEQRSTGGISRHAPPLSSCLFSPLYPLSLWVTDWGIDYMACQCVSVRVYLLPLTRSRRVCVCV